MQFISRMFFPCRINFEAHDFATPLLLILIFSLGYLFVPSEDGAELKMKLVRSLTLCIMYLPTRAPLTQTCYCCLRIYYESAALAFGNAHST